jgi:predicted CXXCH cytochrome family protein
MVLRRGSVIMAATVTLVLVYLAGLAAVFAAGEEDSESSRVPVPEIPLGQGENCVEDTDFMRRNHMTLLMHQRDDTMVRGIRSKQHSLKECVSCHAVEGSDAVAVTFASEKHFCRSCHDYAAVKIDCFQCHASRPDVHGDHGETVARAARQ